MKGSILETLGSPLVRVTSPDGATVAAKVEAFNPGGSAKDRPALSMIEAAEREGLLAPGDAVVEPTSGNTGIGLAIVCAARGYDLTIVMPASKSEERRRLLRAYGAEIELVEGEMTDARVRADRIAAETGAVQLGQFENPANAEAHYRATAPEILEDVEGRTVDALVVSVGTGGTITGTATRLREEFPEMEVIAVEPAENAVLSTGEAGKDEYQGMGPGFVSDLLDVDLLDDVETVELADAEAECRRLAREEGILVGQSSGAASVAARRVAERLAQPELNCPEAPDVTSLSADGGLESGYDDCPLVVTIFPDSGERYLSTGLFD
ncbi:PLP-dependent cysteine synthase family protein [Halalkalicoccus salilacus]|uniref:PLP-dependent cysteine synthase family protein n=1 Tax=Halalkalicoccus TaxID=332246 RepID=UPI002F96E717